ncbi:MAG: hypothetical protein NC313_04095 [Butyrivibrio sp.]|nr:hypothetical protein [Butyrivibrio sp.]
MQKEYDVLDGKVFVVELLSNLGSTNYGWCISKLPSQIIVMGAENIPVGGGYVSTSLQRFYFGALSTAEKETEVDILFTLNKWSDVNEVGGDTFTANVKIIKSDSEEFASYSENAVNSCQDYGLPYDPSLFNPLLVAYGVTLNDPLKNFVNVKYGYPCNTQVKYGYPCGVNDAAFKYGYPCGANDAAFKYGYPCGVNDATLKYGYPCGANDAAFKYGYPCGANDVAFKYGYPCMDSANGMRMYAAPF